MWMSKSPRAESFITNNCNEMQFEQKLIWFDDHFNCYITAVITSMGWTEGHVPSTFLK